MTTPASARTAGCAPDDHRGYFLDPNTMFCTLCNRQIDIATGSTPTMTNLNSGDSGCNHTLSLGSGVCTKCGAPAHSFITEVSLTHHVPAFLRMEDHCRDRAQEVYDSIASRRPLSASDEFRRSLGLPLPSDPEYGRSVEDNVRLRTANETYNSTKPRWPRGQTPYLQWVIDDCAFVDPEKTRELVFLSGRRCGKSALVEEHTKAVLESMMGITDIQLPGRDEFIEHQQLTTPRTVTSKGLTVTWTETYERAEWEGIRRHMDMWLGFIQKNTQDMLAKHYSDLFLPRANALSTPEAAYRPPVHMDMERAWDDVYNRQVTLGNGERVEFKTETNWDAQCFDIGDPIFNHKRRMKLDDSARHDPKDIQKMLDRGEPGYGYKLPGNAETDNVTSDMTRTYAAAIGLDLPEDVNSHVPMEMGVIHGMDIVCTNDGADMPLEEPTVKARPFSAMEKLMWDSTVRDLLSQCEADGEDKHTTLLRLNNALRSILPEDATLMKTSFDKWPTTSRSKVMLCTGMERPDPTEWCDMQRHTFYVETTPWWTA